MKKYDLVLVGQMENINPPQLDNYLQNIQRENEIITNACEGLGLSVKRVGWDDTNFDWTSTKTALIRETWDYFHRIDEFKKWLEKVNDQTQLINPFTQIQWNMDKNYLADIRSNGINIPETIFIELGDSRPLKYFQSKSGWERMVLKPAVSGAARHTYLLNEANLKDHEEVFSELISKEAMLLQRFQEHVTDHGEWTFVIIDGEYTHGILKVAKSGDFRVQDDFGGTVHDYEATPAQRGFAEKVMKSISPVPVYGRVDVILDQHGAMAVQEVELIEPELWFRNCPEAANKLAKKVADYLQN